MQTALQTSELDNIRAWFQSTLGEQVLDVEKAILEQLLSGVFGYHLLQISVQNAPLYEASPIQHRVAMGIKKADQTPFIASATQLPLEDDSIDVVLLHHVLDFFQDRQQILREISRISRPMGHLVIIGFNPLSLWGLWKMFAVASGYPPWNASFIRAGRLMDWLNVLNFRIDQAHYCTHGLPVNRGFLKGSVPDYTRGISRKTNWPFGAIYVIVARKQVGAITPLRPQWEPRAALGKLRAVRPAGRGMTTRNSRG